MAVTDLSTEDAVLDSTILQQFVAMGSEQATQQLAMLQGELDKVFDVPHQPAPTTPVHARRGQSGTVRAAAGGAGADWEENQRRSAKRVFGPPAQGFRNEGFSATSVFDPMLLR